MRRTYGNGHMTCSSVQTRQYQLQMIWHNKEKEQMTRMWAMHPPYSTFRNRVLKLSDSVERKNTVQVKVEYYMYIVNIQYDHLNVVFCYKFDWANFSTI